VIKGKNFIRKAIIIIIILLFIWFDIRNYHTKDYNYDIQNFWNNNFSNMEERYIGRLAVLLEPYVINNSIVNIDQLDSISKILGVSTYYCLSCIFLLLLLLLLRWYDF